MRLLVVSHSCANVVNQQIYAEIQRLAGWDFTLLIPAKWKDEFGNVLEARVGESLHAALIAAPVLGNGNIILHAYRRRLKRVLSDGNFDAVYVNHEPYAIATAQVCLANRGTHRVPLGFYSCQNISKRYPPPFSSLERWVFGHSQFAFPITGAVADVLRSKGFHGTLTVAPLPLSPKLYRPRPVSESPPELQRKPGEFLIGYVGRIVEAKGLRTLVNALARFIDVPWKVAVVGTGSFEREFDALIDAAGLGTRVIRLGFVPHEETPRYLAAFDLLVVPSETQPNWKEQFGRVIVEAMSCGTAVVGSDSGEIPNLIHTSGGGVVFPERNADALADALRRMMLDRVQREECADRGRRWVEENISLEAVAGKMITTIQNAVAAQRNRPRA